MIAGACVFEIVTSQREHAIQWLQELVATTLEVRSSDGDVYDALMFWLSQQHHNKGTSSTLSIVPPFGSVSEPDPTAAVSFVPGFGRHHVTFTTTEGKERKVVVTRTLDAGKTHSRPSARQDEVVTLQLRCTWSELMYHQSCDHQRELLELLRSAKKSFAEMISSRLRVHVFDGGYWAPLCFRAPRRRESMALSGHQLAAIDEASMFFASKKTYDMLGVPWRRGYLLVGPPGTGKSSFISLVASETRAPVYLLSLRDSTLTDSSLLVAVNSVPPGGALVLEDLDTLAHFASPSPSQLTGPNLSLSGVLNALDGIASSTGRILFMTCNDKSRLPTALLRPGRIDRIVPFDFLGDDAVKEMENRFLSIVVNRSTDYDNRYVVDLAGESNVIPTAAEVQNHLLDALVYHSTQAEG